MLTAPLREALPGTRTLSAGAGLAGPAALLFLSGVSALVFQVLWIRQLSLVVGVEVHAIATAISAFFGGLALGAMLLGRLADRNARPLRLYAMLELAVAAACVATTLAMARIGPWFAVLEPRHGWLAWAMIFVLAGVAPFFMGGTLPVLVRAVATRGEAASRAGGLLYAANTAGAIVGALLPAFLLIRHFGVQGSAWVAAALNVLAAIGGAWLARGAAPLEARRGIARAAFPPDARRAILLYTVAGGIALGYEVLWTQMIVPFMSTRTYAFSIVLATYLAGLAAGSAISARWLAPRADPWHLFGLLVAGAGLAGLLEVAVLGDWLALAQTRAEAVAYRWTGSELAGMSARFAVAAASIVLGPTLLLGAAFPAVLRIALQDGRISQGVGLVAGLNTLGGIAGTLLCGFVLLPALGLVRTLALLAVAAAATGLLAVLCGRPRIVARAAAVLVCAASAAVGVLLPADLFARLLPTASRGELVFYEESHGGTVAVVAQGQGGNRFHRLYIQGVSNSGDAMPSLRYMRLQALLPLIIHNGEPRSALVIGYGTGITAGALSRFPGLDTRVVAELLPAVVRAAPNFRGTYGAYDDPGLQIRLRDGRRELQGSPQRYDLITLEPPPPSAAGVANLYSSDFYRLARDRLERGGLVAQWLPLPTQNEEDSRALVASFLAVFPHASVWTTELHEMLLVGSMEPVELNGERIARRYAQPQVAAALREVGVPTVADLLATWVAGTDGLARFAGDIAPVTDDRPAIEYAAWVRPGEFARVLPRLMAQRGPVPLRDADALLLEQVDRQQRQLDLFYGAALAAYARDRDGWARRVERLVRDGEPNAYFSWFLAGAQR